MVKYSKQDRIGIVEFDDIDSKVNVLSDKNLETLNEIINNIENDKDLKALFFISKKLDIFIAGADIKELASIQTKEEALEKCKKGQDLFNRIEGLRIPTFSVVNGACVGGGLELALSCRYILAAKNKKVRFGLPEVKLGITAGFGGTHRLPRKVGPRNASQLIATGRLVNLKEAKRIKLIDKVINDSERFSYKRLLSYGNSKSYLVQLRRLDRMSSLRSWTRSKFEEAEREIFADKVLKEPAKNSISAFLLISKYKTYPWSQLKCEEKLIIKSCGIIGSGVMGKTIAYLLSSEDINVAVTDIDNIILRNAFRDIKNIYREAVKKEILYPEEAKLRFSRISFGKNNLKEQDMVIESITEDMAAKKELFSDIERRIKRGCILATNTSSISIEELSKSLKNAESFLGVHFFNPAYKMKLVEVIPSPFTSPIVLNTVIDFLRRLKKVPIVVKDRSGFLVNRLLLPYLNEALFMIEEGFSHKDIDGAMLEFGMPVGPLELLNQIGLETAFKASKVLEENFGERMRIPEILEDYTNGQLQELPSLATPEVDHGIRGHQEIVERLLSPMKREAELCLKEGIVESREIIDLALLLGVGFPSSKRIWGIG